MSLTTSEKTVTYLNHMGLYSMLFSSLYRLRSRCDCSICCLQTSAWGIFPSSKCLLYNEKHDK